MQPQPLSANTGSQRVQAFLDAMQERNLEKAASFLAPEFEMTFPGPTRLRTLPELMNWSKSRYQSIGKTYERFDEINQADSSVVYCFGTLHGVWLDGSAFRGIRFIDRFEIRNGLFTRQDVWNDLGLVLGR